MKARIVANILKDLHLRKRGRLLILTGARQTGKTTLAQKIWPDHHYISMEDPSIRADFESLSAQDWIKRYPRAVIDEIQKLPILFDVIKACYDASSDVSYVLLGSSQILLLKKVKESLAGRAALQEIYPLALPELMATDWNESLSVSKLIQLLKAKNTKEILSLLTGEPSQDSRWSQAKQNFDHYLSWGGMPATIDPDYTEQDRIAWLEDYQFSYLQRDLADLAQLERLEPFVRCQRALAMKNGELINYSDLARVADVSVPTAKRFLYYLELSYQTLVLPAYFINFEKRLTRMPKIHFLDPGIRRGILKRRGQIDGHEFESAIIAEIYKQVKTLREAVNLYHIRTHDGYEVDCLLELETGFIGIECKLTNKVSLQDFRHLKKLGDYVDKPLIVGLVLSQDYQIKAWSELPLLISVPAAWLFY